MVSANIAIINDLRQFLESLVLNKKARSPYICSANAFDLPFSRVVLMILNLMKRSLSIEIQSFFSHLGLPVPVSKSAFCLQRGKLQACFFKKWNEVLINSYYQHYGARVRRWKGFLVLAIDGTSLSLPDTEVLRELYGSSANQRGAQGAVARSSVLYDTLNGMVYCPLACLPFVSVNARKPSGYWKPCPKEVCLLWIEVILAIVCSIC